MEIIQINNRIEKEYNHFCEENLSDKNLFNDYADCPAVIKRIKQLKQLLQKHKINSEKIDNILQEYIPNIIPAGVKGQVRGSKFNEIVKQFIKTKLHLDKEKFIVKFEKRCKNINTDEIPDFYIKDRKTHKIIIGMNQIDLWSGGAQYNRGSKYLIKNSINNEKTKLLCVVCNFVKIKKKDKKYKLFNTGFVNNTLCYLKNLKHIVYDFFELT